MVQISLDAVSCHNLGLLFRNILSEKEPDSELCGLVLHITVSKQRSCKDSLERILIGAVRHDNTLDCLKSSDNSTLSYSVRSDNRCGSQDLELV